MLEALTILQSSPWVPAMLLGLGVAFFVWRLAVSSQKAEAASDVRSKTHELTKISTANAVTKIEHRP
jgi:hypothetical protein